MARIEASKPEIKFTLELNEEELTLVKHGLKLLFMQEPMGSSGELNVKQLRIALAHPSHISAYDYR